MAGHSSSELDEEHARLVLRIRIRAGLLMQIIAFLPAFDFGSFNVARKMLLGIKQRPEAHARGPRKYRP